MQINKFFIFVWLLGSYQFGLAQKDSSTFGSFYINKDSSLKIINYLVSGYQNSQFESILYIQNGLLIFPEDTFISQIKLKSFFLGYKLKKNRKKEIYVIKYYPAYVDGGIGFEIRFYKPIFRKRFCWQNTSKLHGYMRLAKCFVDINGSMYNPGVFD